MCIIQLYTYCVTQVMRCVTKFKVIKLCHNTLCFLWERYFDIHLHHTTGWHKCESDKSSFLKPVYTCCHCQQGFGWNYLLSLLIYHWWSWWIPVWAMRNITVEKHLFLPMGWKYITTTFCVYKMTNFRCDTYLQEFIIRCTYTFSQSEHLFIIKYFFVGRSKYWVQMAELLV